MTSIETNNGKIVTNASTGNPNRSDELPFPKRTTFHSYYDKPIAGILTSWDSRHFAVSAGETRQKYSIPDGQYREPWEGMMEKYTGS